MTTIGKIKIDISVKYIANGASSQKVIPMHELLQTTDGTTQTLTRSKNKSIQMLGRAKSY